MGNSMVERGEGESFDDLLDLSLLYSWLAGWCAAGMACLYQPFMRLWAGQDLMLPEADMLLFVAYFYLINMNHVRNLYIYGGGLWWELRWAYLLEAGANLALNVLLGRLFGIAGVLVATMITIFVVNYLLCNHVLFRHYFAHQSMATFYRQQFFYLVVAALAVGISYAACQKLFGVEGFATLLGRAVTCLVLPNVVFATLYRLGSRWESSVRLVHRVTQSLR